MAMAPAALAERGRAGSWDWLARRAALHPEREYWRSDAAAWTAGELDARVDRVVGTLMERGVRPGDRVASLLPAEYQHVELLFAAVRLGAILVPLNAQLTRCELQERLDSARPRLVVARPDANVPPGCERLWVPADDPSHDALAQAAPKAVGYVPAGDSPQCLIYTSGTSGRAKGAVLTLSQHAWAARGSEWALGHDLRDAWLLALPLFHVGGQAIVLRAIWAGTRVVALPRFDARRVAAHLTDGSVTLASLVPTMLQRVLEAAPAPHRFSASLRAVLIGGGRADPDLLRQAHAQGLPVRSTFGMTETASQAATLEVGQAPDGLDTSGTPLIGVDVRIAQPGPDGIGEIAVRGPQVFRGYWDEDPRRPGDWFFTGDMGRLDPQGRLVVVDRRTDLIVSGGENVYPAEIERVMASHPEVGAVAVVGVSDPEWGQSAVGVVVPAAGASPTPEGLAQFAAQHLARYKVPRRWVLAAALPLTASGKVSRQAVRALVESGAAP